MNFKVIGLMLCLLVTGHAIAQTNVFSRSEANTGDWGSGNLPWFWNDGTGNRGDPDNDANTRNDVFIGHNTFTSMILNGRFYIHRDFTFQAGASTQRTVSFTSGGGFSFTRSFVNASTATHLFDAPFAIDASLAEIKLTNSAGGGLTFSSSIFTNGNQTFIRFDNGNTGTITFSGAMTQGGSFVKQGGGTFVLNGSADFSGSLFVDEGILRLGRSLSSNVIEIGGGVAVTTALNASLEINNGGSNVSKNITIKNFNSSGGARSITFTHPSSTTATISGAMALEKTVEINNPNTNNGAFLTGIISGAGGITKTGTGLLTLNNQNTYTGLTTINAGTLQLSRTGGTTLPASSSVTCAGGTLQVSTNQTLNNLSVPSGSSLIVDAGTTLTINGTFTSGGIITNNGTIVFTGATNGVAIGTGTVEYTSASGQTIATGTYNNLTMTNSGIKTLGGAVTVGGVLTLNSTTITAIGPNTLTLNGTLTGDGIFRGSTSSNLSIGGTGAFGILRMDTDPATRNVTDVLNNLTINRTSTGSVNLGNNLLQVLGTLTLTSGDFNIGSNSLWLRGSYPAGNINNIKTTAGSQLDFQLTSTGSFTLPAFTEIGGLAIRDNNEYLLNSSPTFSFGIYLGAGILNIGDNTITTLADLGGNSGAFRGGTTSNMVFGSSAEPAGALVMDQSIPGTTNVLNNLTMNRASQTITLNNALRITGTVTPTAGTIASNGNLTLVSNASGNARVAARPDGGANYITGNVTVERYLPNNNPASTGTPVYRRWRYFSLPVTGTSLRQFFTGKTSTTGEDLLDAGDATQNNIGTLITGHQLNNANEANTNGFDWWPSLKIGSNLSNSSIRFYTPSGGFSSATNTPNVITTTPNQQGYMVFIRGDRRNAVTTSNSNVTTLPSLGELRTGNQPITVPAVSTTLPNFTTLGNPYVSPIDFSLVMGNEGNNGIIQNRFWMWDPHLSTTGAWRLVKLVGVTWRAVPSPFTQDSLPADGVQHIQAGQAVIVEPIGAGGSLLIEENDKSANTGNVNIRPFDETGGNTGVFQVNLLQANKDKFDLADGVLATVAADLKDETNDADDVVKPSNTFSALGVALLRQNLRLATEGRPASLATDTLFLQTTGLVANQSYRYSVKTSGPLLEVRSIQLIDRFTNVATNLPLGTITYVDFTPTSDVNSTASNRFIIVMNGGGTLPVSITTIIAQEKQGDVSVNWETVTESKVKHYEVEHSLNGREFGKVGVVKARNNGAATYDFLHTQPGSGSHFYRIRSEELDGQSLLSAVVKVNIGSNGQGFSVFPTLIQQNRVTMQLNGLQKGRYNLQLTNMNGRVLMNRNLEHNGTASAQSLVLPVTLAAGNYMLTLSGEEIRYTERITKQ